VRAPAANRAVKRQRWPMAGAPTTVCRGATRGGPMQSSEGVMVRGKA
jgi:hypothetical protein